MACRRPGTLGPLGRVLYSIKSKMWGTTRSFIIGRASPRLSSSVSLYANLRAGSHGVVLCNRRALRHDIHLPWSRDNIALYLVMSPATAATLLTAALSMIRAPPTVTSYAAIISNAESSNGGKETCSVWANYTTQCVRLLISPWVEAGRSLLQRTQPASTSVQRLTLAYFDLTRFHPRSTGFWVLSWPATVDYAHF